MKVRQAQLGCRTPRTPIGGAAVRQGLCAALAAGCRTTPSKVRQGLRLGAAHRAERRPKHRRRPPGGSEFLSRFAAVNRLWWHAEIFFAVGVFGVFDWVITLSKEKKSGGS